MQPFFSFTFWQFIFNLEKSFFSSLFDQASRLLMTFFLSNNRNYIFINAIESLSQIDVIESSANSTAGAFCVPPVAFLACALCFTDWMLFVKFFFVYFYNYIFVMVQRFIKTIIWSICRILCSVIQIPSLAISIDICSEYSE